jgi:hypothetical protein
MLLPSPAQHAASHKAEDPVLKLGHGFQVPIQCGGVQEDAPREAWQHGIGNATRHIPGPFVELRIVLYYQELVVVLLKDSPELDGCEGPPHNQLHGASVQTAEDARAQAGDKTILNCRRWGLPLRALANISLGATSTLSVSGSRETGGQEFDILIRMCFIAGKACMNGGIQHRS